MLARKQCTSYEWIILPWCAFILSNYNFEIRGTHSNGNLGKNTIEQLRVKKCKKWIVHKNAKRTTDLTNVWPNQCERREFGVVHVMSLVKQKSNFYFFKQIVHQFEVKCSFVSYFYNFVHSSNEIKTNNLLSDSKI